VRLAFREVSVPASFACIRRLYPTTSAAKTAARRRWTRSSAMLSPGSRHMVILDVLNYCALEGQFRCAPVAYTTLPMSSVGLKAGFGEPCVAHHYASPHRSAQLGAVRPGRLRLGGWAGSEVPETYHRTPQLRPVSPTSSRSRFAAIRSAVSKPSVKRS